MCTMSDDDLTQSELLFNDNVDDIVSDIKHAVDDPNMTNSERVEKVSELLKEMEEYTHPLIAQIETLSDPQKHLILCRIARVFPSIIQKELKSVAHWPRSKMTQEECIETLTEPKQLSSNSNSFNSNRNRREEKRQFGFQRSHTFSFSKRRWSACTLSDSKHKDSAPLLALDGFPVRSQSDGGHGAGNVKKKAISKISAIKRRFGMNGNQSSNSNQNQLCDDGSDGMNGNQFNVQIGDKLINREIEESTTTEEQVAAEDLAKTLSRLGYRDIDELYRHSKPTQIFGQIVHKRTIRKESEKANSKRLDKKLEVWRKEKEQREKQIISQLKQRKKSVNSVGKLIPEEVVGTKEDNKVPVPRAKDAEKVMMMMGNMGQCDESDIHAICNAPTKALRLV